MLRQLRPKANTEPVKESTHDQRVAAANAPACSVLSDPYYQPWTHDDLPERYLAHAFCDFAPGIRHRVQTFLEGPAWSLYLFGAAGTKKTSLAIAALVELRRALKPPRDRIGTFVPAYTFARQARKMVESRNDQAVANWRKAPLLILDDLGANRDTPHVTETLLFLLEERYDHERKTIITTNLSLEGFAKHLDPRVASRLQEGMILDLGDTDARTEAND